MRIAIIVGLLLALGATVHAAPAQPRTKNLSIQLQPSRETRPSVHYLRFESVVSPDTVTLEITIEDRLGVQTITTTPVDTALYNPNLHLTRGQLRVDIVAIDRDGERSAPDSWHFVKPTVRPGCGAAGAMFFFMSLPLLVVGLLIVVAVIRALFGRGKAAGGCAPTSLLIADHIARTELRRSASATIASLAGIASAWLFGYGTVAIVITFYALLPISSVIAARRVLRVVGRDGANAELGQGLLLVRSPNDRAHLAVRPGVIEKAQRAGIPSAALQRDV